jgi:hypothetical protein
MIVTDEDVFVTDDCGRVAFKEILATLDGKVIADSLII